MLANIDLPQLLKLGFNQQSARELIAYIELNQKQVMRRQDWWSLITRYLILHHYPFDMHLALFTLLFPTWRKDPHTAPAWIPPKAVRENANISQFMAELAITDVKGFHRYSVNQYLDFWQRMVEKLHIRFTKKPDRVCDLSRGVASPDWFPGTTLNIVDSCLQDPSADTAIIYENSEKTLRELSYNELNQLANRVANGLLEKGFKMGDAIGIAMPMNLNAVAIYLGIIKIGAIVVSIADSFSSQEMAMRLTIGNAQGIFTQDFAIWGGKKLLLYEKIRNTHINKAIVLPCETDVSIPLRQIDCTWDDFLSANTVFTSVPCDPMTPCNILFSSGTTGDPKAIVWNHTTAIKAASDAYLHHNIQPGDRLAWPTNIGWMMGPWLIFAALINHATIALYTEAPKDRAFGEFIEQGGVTMLGVVPTLVAIWRQTHCMEGLDWSAIKVFSSTGECSNPEDMLYLMSLACYRPVIEYCGGTEIGGAYISSTVVEDNCPSLFTTPAMGLDIAIIDEEGNPADVGEVAIIPPSIGLSTTLLNADHDAVYFKNMPKTPDGKILRRHGDEIRRFPNGYYAVLGRVDDTMNLGGIKISAAEIERSLAGLPEIIEVAAIAVAPPDQGPSLLVIYAATEATLDRHLIRQQMQTRINTLLNPLFKIHDVVFVKELPKTASNKIMRRLLRDQYTSVT